MATQHEIQKPIVTITKRVLVYPKFPLNPPKILNLSNLDRQCPKLMYLVFFYNNSYTNLSLNSVFNSLKSGLEETLSFWYPAAGRLSLNPNDGKLNLWCNNQGAVLIEASAYIKISELGDLSQYNDFLENLAYKPAFDGNFSDMPLVVAQVTKFGCGGYSIGIGTSHSLFDGPATFEFLSAWASNSAIFKDKNRHNYQLQKPFHDRAPLVQMGNFNQYYNNSQKPTKKLVRAEAIDHLYQLIQQAQSGHYHQINNLGFMNPNPNNNNNNNNNFVLKTFHLSAFMIENLRRKLLGSLSCSSFEVVTAHLWKARTKALGIRKEKMVCLQFAVDTRNKTIPSLPKGFSGNAYVLASISSKAGELEERSHEMIIEKIKEAKNSINSEYVNAYMEALEGPNGNLPPLMELTLVSDWTRMPFHKVGFLNGEATYVSPLVPPIPQVAYFMQNPIDFRGIDVRVGLPSQALDAFTHYFLS